MPKTNPKPTAISNYEEYEIIIHCGVCGQLKAQAQQCEFGMDCQIFGRIGCKNIICKNCRELTRRNHCNRCLEDITNSINKNK